MRFPPTAADNPFFPRACTDRFPFFGHSTQAEVILREELAAARRRHDLPKKLWPELARLNRRARPPIYEPATPPAA